MPTIQRNHAGRTVTLDPKDYKVAWIAPLEIEAKAALYLLDERHRGRFPVNRGDDYVFHAGAMGGHNIIIATLPAGQEYGTGSAAALASQVKKFFPNLWFGLLVGVATGLPDLSRVPTRDIRLGDVLVGLPHGDSAGLIAYDLGKETEDGFQPLRLGHSLAMTEPIVRAAIGSIKLEVLKDTEIFLPYYEKIRDCEHATGTFADPGQDDDILYLACDNGQEEIIKRPPRSTYQRNRVWYGPIGSGDKLLKNAQKRNELRDRYGIIGLEMEAAGTMSRIPVGVIRGVCDYGDRHKNKDWQPYAAAMAASYARALLDEIPPNDTSQALTLPRGAGFDLSPAANRQKVARGTVDFAEKIHEPCYYIPFMRNTRFTGRTAILNTLEDKFFGPDQSHKVALVGLGGVGKTQIALRFAYQMKEKRPDYSIFWVTVLSDETAESAYVDIAKKLGLQKNSEDDDVKELVCQHLSSNKAGKWLLIVDNADDQGLILGSAKKSGLEENLPQSEDGIVLLTTRSRPVAVEFAQSDVIDAEQMDQEEATTLLEKSLIQKQLLQDEASVVELLTHLTFLPLAITQAAAYLNQTRAPIRTYLNLLRGAEADVTRLLGREFRDNTRYRGSRNAVGTTWIVSFDQIQRSDPLAVDLLSFMSCIEPKAIPQSILPDAEPDELEWAIGTLCSYSFLVRREESNVFDMHSLVHTATRGWLEKQDRETEVSNHVICHIAASFPAKDDAHYDLRRAYLPHAMRLLNRNHENKIVEAYLLFEKVGHSFNVDRRFKEAIRCFEEVCRWRKDFHSETDYLRLTSEYNLARVYLDDRRIKDAIKLFEHVVAVRKETLDEKDRSRLTSEHELARAYLDDRRIEDAIEMLEHVVAIEAETLDEKDHSRLTSEQVLASAYLNDRRIKDAIKLLEHVVEVQKDILDEKDHFRLTSEHALATAYLDDQRITDAIKMLEHVVEVKKEILDEKDHSRLTSEQVLATAYLDDRRIKDAIKILEHVVAIEAKTLDEKDHYRLTSEHALATAYLDDRRIKDAIMILEHVVAVRKETLDEKDHFRLTSEQVLGTAYLHDRRNKDAIKIFEHVVAIHEKTLAKGHPDRLASQHALAGAYQADNQGHVSSKYNRFEQWPQPPSVVADAIRSAQTEFADADETSTPPNPPTSGVSPDVRQLFNEVAFPSLFDDGARIVRFIHGEPGAQTTVFDRFRIGLEQRIGQRIDWSPFPPISRPCLPSETKVVWKWGGKELSVILSREEAYRYYATCRPIFQSSNNQMLPFTSLDCNSNTRVTPALGTTVIHNPQAAADMINRPDQTVQTHPTAGQTTPQNSQGTEIYWCIDKIFNEPIKTVFRCIERADQIREDSSFYRQVNRKLQSAGGTGVKGWITPYISWKRVTAAEFIKFVRIRGDWVKRDNVELPQSDHYDHNVGTPEGTRMMILAEELIAGLHDPKGVERGNYMVNALPKRKCPPPLPTLRGTEAWGLHAKMGFSAGRIIWWFTSSFIFLVAFATVWLATVDKTDVQTALTPGTVIVTVLTLMLGIFQTLNQ